MSMPRFSYRLIQNVRSSAVLTDAYVSATINDPEDSTTLLPIDDLNQLILLVSFTIGSLDSGQIKVEFSADGTTWYQETAAATSAGTITNTVAEHTIGATGNYRIAIPVLDRYVRVSAKGTGTVTNSLMAIDAVVGRS